MDKIFYQVYGINEMKILPDGTIKSSFDKEFKEEMDVFVQTYLQEKKHKIKEQEWVRIELEKKKKKKIEEQERRHMEEKKQLDKETNGRKDIFDRTDPWHEIGYSRKSYTTNSYKQTTKKSYTNYSRDDNYYKDKVNKAILGYRYGVENLVGILTKGGSSEYMTIKKLFQDEISKGNLKAEKVFDEVMKSAGLD
jgi:hypothetical protein